MDEGAQWVLAVAVVLTAGAYLMGRAVRAALGARHGGCGGCAKHTVGQNLGRKVPLVQLDGEPSDSDAPRTPPGNR